MLNKSEDISIQLSQLTFKIYFSQSKKNRNKKILVAN